MSSVSEFKDRSDMATMAVLMTCHNRREKTRTCLATLEEQELPATVTLSFWIVDDGSSDGTADVIRERCPGAHVLRGDGSLFWCGGMRLAWASAVEDRPDFLLLLNDDVELRPSAIATLLESWRAVTNHGCHGAVVVGSCQDPQTGAHTYGGQRRRGRHPGKLVPVPPQGVPVECDTFQGNCVIVPRRVYEQVGELTPFRHAMADTDYGYRTVKDGFRVTVAPGYVAYCERQSAIRGWRDRRIPRRERLRALLGPKGLPPADWALFLKRHAGIEWPFYWLWTYVQAICSTLW